MEKALSWEIDNFSERNDVIISDRFSSGGCEWAVTVDPKGYRGSDHFSLFLFVGNPKSLRPGWKRKASFCFVLLNRSGNELYRGECKRIPFCAEISNWGFSFRKTLPVPNLQEEGFLENNKLTIEVYMEVVEVVHQGKSTANDMFDFNGFQILSSQVIAVSEIYGEHPNFAVDVIEKNQEVKTAYINLLLGLSETLSKSSQNVSVAELTNAQAELTELTEAGFKLDWMKSKLEEIYLERKKALSDGSRVQQLEERVKNVELTLSDLKVELDKEKIKSNVAGAKLSSFEFIDFLIKRFFLSCFSFSKY